MKQERKKTVETMEDVFGPVIYAYTRQQAIDDGVLVDVSGMAGEAGIKYPCAVTRAVFDEYISVPEELRSFQDEKGRLWDVLWMFSWAVRSNRMPGDTRMFQLIVQKPEGSAWLSNEEQHEGSPRQRLVTLKAVCGAGDDGKPCITIMMPHED